MNISASVITKRIKQLEAFLEVELLRRSTRQLTVTDMGSAYYERCSRILAEVEEATNAVSSMNWGLTGLMKVSCTASFSSRYLAQDVSEFQLLHPELTIDLHHNDRVYDPIQEGYDICVQTNDILSDVITKRPIVTFRRLFATTPRYIEKYGAPKGPDDLINHRFAHNNWIYPGNEIELEKDGEKVLAPIKPVLLTNNIWLLRAAILHGECIGMVPVFYFADELAAGTMVPVLTDYDSGGAELSAYYRRSPHVPLKIRSFINFVLNKYQPRPPWQEQVHEILSGDD